MIAPYEGGVFTLTSRLGFRSIEALGIRNEPHTGVDLVGQSSKIVLCVKAGIVAQSRIVTDRTNKTWEWGHYVCVRSPDGTMIYYCHLASRAVSVGERVNVGSVIGVEGATGLVTGRHLHLEARYQGQTCALPASESDKSNICAVLGVPNEAGTYHAEDDIGTIIRSCSMMETLWRPRMVAFQRQYEFGDEFWRRIARSCRAGLGKEENL